ncbi:MAG: hypothetical protein SCK70_16155, partial [bacterium]|nr:hypothetical protein [bacterium]
MRKLILVVGVMLMMVSYCTLDFPEDPKAPKWDVEIERIPLFSADTLRLGDQLSPDDFNRLIPDSVLSINSEDEKGINLKDKLKIQAQQSSFSEQLGEFEILAEQSAESNVHFVDILPELASLVGTSAVLDTTPLSPVEKFNTLEDFISVSVVSGQVRYDVTNNLGFEMVGDVRLALIDVGRGNVAIDTVRLESMENNQSKTYYIDLQGKVISSEIKTVFFGVLYGSNGESVYIPTTSSLDVSITPETIIVDEAHARLKSQLLNLSGKVDISSDSLTVKTAEIESGNFYLRFENHFEFDIHLDIHIPSLKDGSNNVVSTSMNIPAGGWAD